MSIFKIPVSIIRDIEKKIANFWWRNNNKANGLHWRKWELLKLTKKEGGLGFKDLSTFNMAMLGKQAWRLSHHPDNLVSQIMKGLYFPNCTFWQAGKGSRPSWGWQSLLAGREVISPQVMWAVGNGQKISIRTDKWLKMGVIGGPAARNEPSKVAELIDFENAVWKEDLLRSMFDQNIVMEILATPFGLPTTEDKLIWLSNKSGRYTVKSGYLLHRKNTMVFQDQLPTTSYQVSPELWKHIWNASIQPKIKFFLWSACQNALPTMENLYRRKIVPAPICPLCGLEPETIEHTFLLCPWITQLWTEPSLQVEVNRVGLTRFDEWLYKVHTSSRTSQEFELLANVLWCIWKDQNHHIFRKSPLNFHHTLFRAITSQDSFATWNPKLKNQKKEADLHNKWQPPKPGVLKINIDASFGPPSPQHLMSHGRKLKMTSSICMETYNWLALLATQRPQPYRQQ